MNNIFQYKKLLNKFNFKIKIAQNPNTSIHTLDKLSRDEDGWVRRRVTLNPNTSIEALDKLSRDKNDYVREYVAKNSTWIKYMENK